MHGECIRGGLLCKGTKNGSSEGLFREYGISFRLRGWGPCAIWLPTSMIYKIGSLCQDPLSDFCKADAANLNSD